MRYPAAETAQKHQRILDEALRLFSERGFPDVTVAEIMKAAGLTHGPFYNHFASKEALIAECVEQGLRESTLVSPDRAPPTEAGRTAYIDGYLSTAHRDAPGTGCVLAALAAEISRETGAQSPFTAELKAFVDKLSTHFPWSGVDAARGDTIRALAAMVGAMVLARAVNDEVFSNEILDETRLGLTTLP